MRASHVFLLALAGALLFLTPGAAFAGAGNTSLAGGEVRMSADVAGDLLAAGGRVEVDRPVAGDAAVVGGSVRVSAPIGDDLRTAAGDIEINAPVGGELIAAGGHVLLGPSATISRDARIRGGTLRIEGHIGGALDARGQDVTVDGIVDGDVHAAAQTLRLGPHANIRGALTVESPQAIQRAEGAIVAGAVTASNATPAATRMRERERERRTSSGFGWGNWLGAIGMVACAAVFLLVAPPVALGASERVRATPWKALGAGLAALAVAPVLMVLLIATVLGIPLALIVLALYPVLLLLGFVIGVLFIARRGPSLTRREAPSTFGGQMGWFALATLVVMLVGAVPLAGGVFLALLGIAGAGALVLELVARRRGGGAAPPPVHTGVVAPA